MEPKPTVDCLPSGTVLERKWTIVELIGSGATAHVYRATHRNGAKVALKVLHRRLLQDKSINKRFEREALLANRVDDPGVVQVQDSGVTEEGCPFLVTEYLQGDTLESLRQSAGGKLPLPQVLEIGDELLRVLSVAHAQQVLHRDIKPSNLFRTSRGDLKVLDFGLARELEPSEGSMTSYSAVLGTVGFMAPEQAQGRWDLVDETTDVWAAAATLLKLATGLDVHEGHTPQERVARAATQPVPSIAARAPDLPHFFVQALEKATAYSKRERFGSAAELREALLERSQHKAVEAKAIVPSTRNKPVGVVAGVALGGFVVGLLWLLSNRQTASSPSNAAQPTGSLTVTLSVEQPASAPLAATSPNVLSAATMTGGKGNRTPAEKPSSSVKTENAPSASAPPALLPSANPLDRRH